MSAERVAFERVPRCLEISPRRNAGSAGRWKKRPGQEKQTKPPRTVRGGRANGYARNYDPSTWSTLADAQAALGTRQIEGIGLELLGLPGFAAIDLDDVRDADGNLLPGAANLIARSGLTPS